MHMGLKRSVLVQIMDIDFTYVFFWKRLTITGKKILIYINQTTYLNG